MQNAKATMKTKLLATAILISSCLTTMAFPPMITEQKVSQIRIGQTTEADLVHLFGAPTTRMTDIQHQVALDWFRSRPIPWQGYLPLIGSFVGGLDVEAQQLYVLLAPNGTVLRFEASSSQGRFKTASQTVAVRQHQYAK